MKRDLPQNIVQGVLIAVVLESESPTQKTWHVYLINEKQEPLKNVLVTSRGYGRKDKQDVKTSTLRHFLGDVAAQSHVKIEAIDEQVFGLTNEYWLSYYLDKVIFDKKYIFLPESIVEINLVKVPLVNAPGVVIGGMN